MSLLTTKWYYFAFIQIFTRFEKNVSFANVSYLFGYIVSEALILVYVVTMSAEPKIKMSLNTHSKYVLCNGILYLYSIVFITLSL